MSKTNTRRREDFIPDFTKLLDKPDDPVCLDSMTQDEWRQVVDEYLEITGIVDIWENRVRLKESTIRMFRLIEAKQKVKWSNAFYYFFTLMQHLKHDKLIREIRPRSETKQIKISIARDLYHNALCYTKTTERDIPKVVDYVAEQIEAMGVDEFLAIASHNEERVDIGENEFYEN